MKRFKFLSVCFIVFSAFLTSCSGDVEPLDPAVIVTPEQPEGGFFQVDFNGDTFEANTTIAYVSSGNILISGVKSTGQTVSIALDGAAVGTYDNENNILSYSPSPNSEYDYVNFNEDADGNYISNGSVVITEIDTEAKTITGTFTFTGYWSDFTDENPPAAIEFTNGSFSIPYISSEDPGDGDFVKAKIDGIDFEDEIITTAFASSGEFDIITINGINEQDQQISLFINDDAEVGTHVMTNEPLGNMARAAYRIGDANPSYSATGSLTISTKTADRISGTFNFTTTTGEVITAGSFDVEY
ncbi:DUF6252 family protein [Flavobacterium soli]|uniref:DUF6252 family protein n=1 Tax=Flavobacterium soli TaxID=344881 RepID=UPI0004797B57|nr:DUF6252 family protein [Flavobacterium soli]